MDNTDFHITLDLIECTRENQEGVHHILPTYFDLLLLKAKFSSIATQPGHMNKHQIVKAKFLSVLSYIVDEIYSLAKVKETFRKTGIALLNSYAVDKS